ncbi:hypothetical protein [Spiroplasma endosymbiont of Nebria brevicollis]|uniref:hypothetical protein n=1 Tax=Spiroplasma endosymbiont of Nebria brevicollis TaxID=3066284 RepID=UPI00313E16CF
MDIFGISFNIDFKQQQTTVAEEGIEYIAPSISTLVAPCHKVQVLSYLNSFISSQNLTFDSDI